MTEPKLPPVRPLPAPKLPGSRPLPASKPPAFDRRRRPLGAALALLAAAGLGGCASLETRTPTLSLDAGLQLRTHREGDDLLTAGLGEAGLRSPVPPAFANPEKPTALELRRRAVWANWRGIADLAPDGGYGSAYGTLAPVPGREYHALATLPGRTQPHRLMLQLPDGFDAQARCVVVAASSGSRGIYGAIALAGAWGLPRGCAVAYTDKGAGTGYVDTANGVGTGLDGLPATGGQTAEFEPARHTGDGVAPIAVKHAHSGDNPEADWGRHMEQAARFALQVLQLEHPQAGPWTFDNTRVIALGVSNGGGAVLRAAELPGDWLDGAVAISPNVLPGAGGRPLFDYGTEAAIFMPCALNAAAFDAVALARPGGAKSPAGSQRCASLHALGKLDGDDAQAQAEAARRLLNASGWTDEALAAGSISTVFDLWRAVNVTYASSYAGTGPADMPCGYRLAAIGADGAARAPTAAERAAWWSDASGIPPGAGVGILDALATGPDPTLPGLLCLRALWDDANGPVRDAIEATRAKPPRPGLPVVVIHGTDDGLVPEAFSGAAYAQWVRASGGQLDYQRVENAQHFDAFLGLPALRPTYVPLLPHAYRALDTLWQQLTKTGSE